MIKKIIFTENDTVKFSHTQKKQTSNPVVRVIYAKLQIEVEVTFYNNFLNVDWSGLNFGALCNSHGLIGNYVSFHYNNYTTKLM